MLVHPVERERKWYTKRGLLAVRPASVHLLLLALRFAAADGAAVADLAVQVPHLDVPAIDCGALHRHVTKTVDPGAEGVDDGAGRGLGALRQFFRQGHDVFGRAGKAADELGRIGVPEADLLP